MDKLTRVLYRNCILSTVKNLWTDKISQGNFELPSPQFQNDHRDIVGSLKSVMINMYICAPNISTCIDQSRRWKGQFQPLTETVPQSAVETKYEILFYIVSKFERGVF